MPCITVTSVSASALAAGLQSSGPTTPAIGPGLFFTNFDKNAPDDHPAVDIQHRDNGAVVDVLCIGVVGATLDPALAVCTDLPTTARTDIAKVRQWALAAEQTIARQNRAIIKLTSSDLLFVACRDPFFPTADAGAGSKAQIQIFVQRPTGVFSDTSCR